MDLDRVGRLAAERAGEDHRAHDEVVGERDVGPGARGDLADRGDVALEVGRELVLAEVLERARLDALVAVGHVDGQQPAEVGPVDGRARRVAAHLELQRAPVPVAGGVDPRERERLAVLAQQVDLVPVAGERRGELGVVDVRPGAAQQVAVEDENPHRAHFAAADR